MSLHLRDARANMFSNPSATSGSSDRLRADMLRMAYRISGPTAFGWMGNWGSYSMAPPTNEGMADSTASSPLCSALRMAVALE